MYETEAETAKEKLEESIQRLRDEIRGNHPFTVTIFYSFFQTNIIENFNCFPS